MEENTKIPVNNGQKMVIRNPDGTIKSGVLNPAGKPLGTVTFKTKFLAVIDKLAKQNNITAEEVEQQLLLVGYKKAKDGDYNFYRDLFDRMYGRPTQVTEIKGELLTGNITDEQKANLIKLLDDQTSID